MQEKDSPIVWAEHNLRYAADLMEEFQTRGPGVEMIKTGRDLLREADRILQTSRVLMIELVLPLGELQRDQKDFPPELYDNAHHLQRGLWLVKELLAQREAIQSEIEIVIFSSNLDVDSMLTLEKIGILPNRQWKKPAEFDVFTEQILAFAQQDK